MSRTIRSSDCISVHRIGKYFFFKIILNASKLFIVLQHFGRAIHCTEPMQSTLCEECSVLTIGTASFFHRKPSEVPNYIGCREPIIVAMERFNVV